MPKGENFGLHGCARPEQPGHGVPDQLEEIAHRRDYRPIDSCFGFTELGADFELLADVERHIADGDRRIERQRVIVMDMERVGHNDLA
jgi:hypothetical protein